MSNLKQLVYKTLSKKNKPFWKLDSDIIKGTLSDYELSAKHGKTPSQLAGRRTSLVVRGHISKKSRSAFVKALTDFANDIVKELAEIKVEPVKVRKQRTNMTAEVSEKVKTDIYDGMRFSEIALKYDIALPTVYRLKKLMADINFKPTKDTNTYTNVKGVNKDIARHKMSKYYIDSNIQGEILSLPHIAATIEKMILADQPNQTFLGVERHKATYNKLRKTIRDENLPITAYHGDLSDKIYGESENRYAGLCADLCGGMGKHSKEIEYALKNDIVKRGGIIALTVRKPLRGTNKNDKKILTIGATITNNKKDNRCQSDKAMEAYLHRIMGKGYDLVEIFNYKDKKENGNDTQEMVLFIIKRK